MVNGIFENNKHLQRMKGHTNNPNGRPKGTPNKVTADLKQWVSDILNNGKERFAKYVEQLPPDEYIRTFTMLLNYALPKMASTTPDELLRKEKEMLQELILSLPDEMVNRVSTRLLELQNKENDENKIE